MKHETQQYYADHAQQFTQNTLNLDLTELYQRFLCHLLPNANILDAGCGPGRDSKAFKDLGYQVTAMDSCAELVEHARRYAGVETRDMSFQALEDIAAFHGIWASASLLHLRPDDLGAVFKKLALALKSRGVLYASFKYGDFAGMRNGRWFTDLNEVQFSKMQAQLPEFELLESWHSKDVRPQCPANIWLNLLLRKTVF